MGLIKFIKVLWRCFSANKTKNTSFVLSDITEYHRKSFSSHKIKILMITDFSELSDNYTPILAVNKCNKQGMNIQLDIYGQGKDLNKIQKFIAKQNCPNIQYKGIFQDFTTIYKDYDLFVTSSYTCDVQMNIVEAMRAKLPLILTDIKEHNISEFIRGNGSVIPNHASNLYYETLKSFYSNKSQLMTMGQNSRKLYEEEFTIKQIVNKTINIYREALEV